MKDLLLFIHGLGSNRKVWHDFKEIINNDNDISNKYDVEFYEYPTHYFHIPFISRLLDLDDLAKGLKTEINQRYDKYQSVALICHSMGGLIARKYLLNQYERKKKLKIYKVIFYSVPHKGSALACFASSIVIFQNQIKQLCRYSEFIKYLNESWARTRIQNAFSLLYIAGGKDMIVDRESSLPYLYNESEEIIVDKDHKTIIRPKSANDMSYILFRRHLLNDSYVGDSDLLYENFINVIKIRLYLDNKTISSRTEEDNLIIK